MAVVEKCWSQQVGLEGIMGLLRATLLFGVQCYVVVEIANGCYTSALAVANVVLRKGLCMPGPEAAAATDGICSFGKIYYGAQFVASSIAIFNLFSFERKLHGALRQFKPGRKFWSMKIPISFGFFGVIVLEGSRPITHFTTDEVNIVDAIIRAYLMGLVSLLNIYAWRAREEFYIWDELRFDGLIGDTRNTSGIIPDCLAMLNCLDTQSTPQNSDALLSRGSRGEGAIPATGSSSSIAGSQTSTAPHAHFAPTPSSPPTLSALVCSQADKHPLHSKSSAADTHSKPFAVDTTDGIIPITSCPL
jgi:hypothetical protein